MVEKPKRMTTVMVFRVPVIERTDDVEIGSRDVGWCEIHHASERCSWAHARVVNSRMIPESVHPFYRTIDNT